MSEAEVKRVTEDRHHHGRRQYGTFSAVPAYSQPAAGLLQPGPSPPPGSTASPPPQPSYYYHYGYEAVPGYAAVVEGRPLRQPHLPCCGIGIGWFLFIIGFFLAATPWFVGVFVLLCVRLDYREKPGLIACTIAAVIMVVMNRHLLLPFL